MWNTSIISDSLHFPICLSWDFELHGLVQGFFSDCQTSAVLCGPHFSFHRTLLSVADTSTHQDIVINANFCPTVSWVPLTSASLPMIPTKDRFFQLMLNLPIQNWHPAHCLIPLIPRVVKCECLEKSEQTGKACSNALSIYQFTINLQAWDLLSQSYLCV